MSKAPHTAGPWAHYGPNAAGHFMIRDLESEDQIAEVSGHTPGNAPLVAAAPALYASLKGLVSSSAVPEPLLTEALEALRQAERL